MPPSDYRIRLMQPADFAAIGQICRTTGWPTRSPTRRDSWSSRSDCGGWWERAVVADHRADPVLSAHLKDGWSVVRPIHGYLQHDAESANWPHSLPLGRMFHTLFSAE